MLLSDRRPTSEAPFGEAPLEARRKTLPPPEWTSPRAGGSRPPTMSAEPLPRRLGTRAEEAWLRARAEEARVAGDRNLLREACTTLARWLASRERDLDEAVDLGTTALSLGADSELRREVSAWLESLGEAARAASILKPIASAADADSVELAYVLLRSGVLKARAGAAAGAAAAFEAAMAIDPSDALPAELMGAISAWQPDAVSVAVGAEAYVEAARRRSAQEQEDAAYEDLWRAFSADPSSEPAAAAVAEAMQTSGRPDAADEILRAHARSLSATDDPRAALVHARRRDAALEAGEPLRALGAALDQALDAALEGDDGQAFDALLLGAGMLDALAARLELRAEQARTAAERASHFAELGRLCLGPLSDTVRALSAYVAALAADASCDEAIGGLHALLSDLPRVEASGDDPRADPIRRLMASIDGARDEPHRVARLLEELRRVVPRLSAFFHPAEESSEPIAAASRAWVRASHANAEREVAIRLEGVAALLPASLRAALLCAAADRYIALRDAKSGRRAAEAAVVADPSSVRAIATLADCGLGDGLGDATGEADRAATAALERAIALAGPRIGWCIALADALEALGEIDLSVAWSQRCVAMRPGDIGAIERLLERLLRSGDAGRLADALAWLLSQPQPLASVAAPFGRALGHLSRVDADRAAVVARRALDVFGPKSAPVREALLDAASRAGDEAFVAAVFERWLSCGTVGAERRHLFERLAELYEHLGDEDGQARIVARAVREGLGSPAIDAHLERLSGRPATPDAQLWRMAALASRLVTGADADGAAWAWRELGAGLWDLADDRVAAIAAWERAARLAGSGGHATLAFDLVAFAGTEFAFDYLGRLIDAEPDDRSAAAIAADVGRAALTLGQPHTALDLAARGVARCPSWADALEVAELAAPRAGDLPALSRVYERVGARAMGRFGRRAAHYRAARFFERRGEPALALRHATQAFAALPSEGSSLQMLARIAERSGHRGEAVRALESVAESADGSVRADWLLRAAGIAGVDPEGAKKTVDLLLGAIATHPTVSTVSRLRDAVRGLLASEPDERDALEMRFTRAARAAMAGPRSPAGARVALAFVTAAIELFGDADTALTAFEHAFSCDADVEEFAVVTPLAPALARAGDAVARAAAMLVEVEASRVSAGVASLGAIQAMAVAAGDAGVAARAAVLAAVREPDDDSLVVEADAAGDASPEAAARLAACVSPARRAQAILAIARTRVASGANAEAAPLFERALAWVGEEERVAIARELRAATQLGCREPELPDARLAGEDAASPRLRADRWGDVAESRERRGDIAGALRALLEACHHDPDSLERWSALERVAEIAGDDDARVLSLERILTQVGPGGRAAAYRRLARAHEQRGDGEAAERTWRTLLALDPDDEEADQEIEAIMAARGRFADLADHLGRRADRLAFDPARFEMLRAVRLRRAAILEQRLGLVEDACAELERLLIESPDNSGGLRYLADLLERHGEYARAAALWSRAAVVESDLLEREDLELRAGRASGAAGNVADALDCAGRVLALRPSNLAALAMRRDAARALGADAELGDALESLAAIETDTVAKGDLLVEAALAAARTANLDLALSRASRAAVAVPARATPQLLARGLEYRLRGAGTPEEARATIDGLGRIEETLGADDVALRSFLLAEALDVVQGQAAGLRELDSVAAVAGDHALVALGIAERLAAQGQYAAAVEAYRRALAGPFLGLRAPSTVAMSAADSAMRAGLPDDARYFLAIAERYEDTRFSAQAWRTLLAEQGTPRSLGSAAAQVSGPPFDDLEAAVQNARTPGERARAHFALGRRQLDRGDTRGAELLLREALGDGLIEAGDALAELLQDAPDRAGDLLRVRRQQVALEPGDIGRLERLRASAIADGDAVYAAAVDHVLRAVDAGSPPLAPPPLAVQPEQPGMFTLLTRPSSDHVGEALGLLWEGAAQLFMRDTSGHTVPDASQYVMPGIERVVPGARPTIARIYDLTIRALDAPRIPLFVSRSGSGPPSSRVGLLWPPSVFLSGDVREETTELLFELGRGMSAALPQNVLCLGLPPLEGRAVVEALRVAFAPPEAGRQVEVRAAALAEAFWHIVPARMQRRIQVLLSAGFFPEYDELVERALQSGRRVGMFLAGDFGHAARSLLARSAGGSDAPLAGDLRAMCERSPMLADLLRLAVSPEYASARWHSVEPTEARHSGPPSQFPVR